MNDILRIHVLTDEVHFFSRNLELEKSKYQNALFICLDLHKKIVIAAAILAHKKISFKDNIY